ncbi:hypothetical protein DHW03_02305 [Pedobacter yonginense]|uniref:Abortive infection protein-like C-terminal domain-containing protein n=1 Tax=Pedobacter yonginense TaxID=651869 RepID=A0A317ES54_9SPHI|nr:hypothetical protein [Pedobacter yonginense]PWS28699.1 hypothetical protein DHW03_02305 [Pedobacter yonginense]
MIKASFLQYASDILASTNSTLSWGKLVKYFNAKSVDYNVDIPHTSLTFPSTGLANKRTGFYENLVHFTPEQQFEILEELCDIYNEVAEVTELKGKLYAMYGGVKQNTAIAASAELVAETQSLLKDFPDADKQYNSGLDKITKGIYERNALDDLRLSLELLLKGVLNNSKSLENQRASIGEFFKVKNISPQIANMLWTLIDQYSKYQNEHVKHNDKINPKEINVILDLTTTFMKHLLQHV